jgi:hypothetical protein
MSNMINGPCFVKFLGVASFWAYLAALLFGGLIGYASPGYELSGMYHIEIDRLGPEGLNSLFDHSRFLKSYVLGFCVFAVVFRGEIFSVRSYNRIFLGTLFLSAFGRLISLIIDGTPNRTLLLFMAIEFFFGICMFVYSRTIPLR